jgi:hypothetical protein
VRAWRRFGFALTFVLAAVGLYVWTLPPRALPTPRSAPAAMSQARVVRGVLHVHSRRSDGSGSLDDIARAAARAGLDFVVFGDHGDGTRRPESPHYRHGVLCIDGVEISTSGGHVLAVGLGPAPYPLAGAARDVVADILRFGGLAIATHPDSPKPSLSWQDWEAPLDGFEWLNTDSEWRDESPAVLVSSALHYLARGPETIAALFDPAPPLLRRWDELSARGLRLVALPGADAHARLGWREDETGAEESFGSSAPVPSYETVFRVASANVVLDAGLTGAAQRDAGRVLAALRDGRVYTAIDAYMPGARLEFVGETPEGRVSMGGVAVDGTLQRLTVQVSHAPVKAVIRLLRNGVVVRESSGLRLDVERGLLHVLGPRESAVAYRAEVVLERHGRGASSPWLVSNPIWVRRTLEPSERRSHEHEPPLAWIDALAAPGGTRLAQWQIERDSGSRGTLAQETDPEDERTPRLRFEFGLGRGRPPHWVAAAMPLPMAAREAVLASGVALRLRAQSPMRVSVQLRAPAADRDLRWVTSTFVGEQSQVAVLPIERFQPVSPAAAAASLDAATTLLLVVDATNTIPGTTGRVWIESVMVPEAAR